MRMRDVARGKKQQVQLEGRKVQLYAAFLAAKQLLITVITTSARRIHRSGRGSRALPAVSELANKSCRSTYGAVRGRAASRRRHAESLMARVRRVRGQGRALARRRGFMILVNVNAANSTDQTIFGVLLIVIQFMPVAIGVSVGALNKNSKVKGKAQGLDEEAKGLGDKISSEEPEPSQKSPLAKGAPPPDEEQPVVLTA